MSGKDGYTTKSRVQIRRFLAANVGREFEMSELSDFLESQSAKITVTAINRYLKRLIIQGTLIKTVCGPDGRTTFLYVEGLRGCCSHLHLRCSKCDKILHLDCVFMKDVLNHVKEDHGFVINCRGSFLTGLCRECAEYEQAQIDITLEECKRCNVNPDNE